MQIINHFSIPFKVFEGSTCLGTALPTEEFCVPLDSYRWLKHIFIQSLLCLIFSVSNNHTLFSPTPALCCPPQVWAEPSAGNRGRRWQPGRAVWVLRGLQLRRRQQPAARDTAPADLPSPWGGGWCADGQHCASKRCCDIQRHWRCWGELWCAVCASLVAFHPATQPAALPYLIRTEGRCLVITTQG